MAVLEKGWHVPSDYDKALEKSMIAETKTFFREVPNRGFTLREFLNSDGCMMNGLLAQHCDLGSRSLS